MTSTLAAAPPNVPAYPLCVLLPEPAANRAQIIPGPILLRWLSGVISRDGDGYALIAGNGCTLTLLYGNGTPLTSLITRGPDGAGLDRALDQIQADSVSGCFVMTYKLPVPAGELLSGLFAEPSHHSIVTGPLPDLHGVLEQFVSPGFSGAAVFSAEDSIWAVALINSGEIHSSYGVDDRTLKVVTDDITPLLSLDQIHVSIHPPHVAPDIDAAFSETRLSTGPLFRDTSIVKTEAAMIEMLSRFEHRLSQIDPATDESPELLVRSLAEICIAAADLSSDIRSQPGVTPPEHPLLAAYWDQEGQRIDVDLLVTNLDMASIPDAWLSGADALLLAINQTVELQLTWLAMSDEVSASTLREALDDLLQLARQLLKGWRDDRQHIRDRSKETG